jgi:transposase
LGHRARGRRKKREPGRGHYDKDRPAIIAWVSRQGAVVIQATKDFTVKTVQKAAKIAMRTGSRLYTDSASSYRALKGYVHAFVNHTQKEYARGDVHENRAECLFSLLKPYLRVFRGVSKPNLPGYVGFFQFLRNFRQQNAFEQAARSRTSGLRIMFRDFSLAVYVASISRSSGLKSDSLNFSEFVADRNGLSI